MSYENAGRHSADHALTDTEEVASSTLAAPTRPLTSGNAGRGFLCPLGWPYSGRRPPYLPGGWRHQRARRALVHRLHGPVFGMASGRLSLAHRRLPAAGLVAWPTVSSARRGRHSARGAAPPQRYVDLMDHARWHPMARMGRALLDPQGLSNSCGGDRCAWRCRPRAA